MLSKYVAVAITLCLAMLIYSRVIMQETLDLITKTQSTITAQQAKEREAIILATERRWVDLTNKLREIESRLDKTEWANTARGRQ